MNGPDGGRRRFAVAGGGGVLGVGLKQAPRLHINGGGGGGVAEVVVVVPALVRRRDGRQGGAGGAEEEEESEAAAAGLTQGPELVAVTERYIKDTISARQYIGMKYSSAVVKATRTTK